MDNQTDRFIAYFELTGSAIVMRIDWSWWITVCFAMDWQITVTSTNDSFRCCARFIIDTAQWWQVSAQWSPGRYSWWIVGTDIIRTLGWVSWKMDFLKLKPITKINSRTITFKRSDIRLPEFSFFARRFITTDHFQMLLEHDYSLLFSFAIIKLKKNNPIEIKCKILLHL